MFTYSLEAAKLKVKIGGQNVHLIDASPPKPNQTFKSNWIRNETSILLGHLNESK